jgi:hypothetical protein
MLNARLQLCHLPLSIHSPAQQGGSKEARLAVIARCRHHGFAIGQSVHTVLELIDFVGILHLTFWITAWI